MDLLSLGFDGALSSDEEAGALGGLKHGTRLAASFCPLVKGAFTCRC